MENLYAYVSSSPNLEYQARFRVLVSLNLPCIVKRVGIRLNSEEISNGASALFLPAAFATRMTWYRDYYHFKHLNGKFSPLEEDVVPKRPNFEDFLDQIDPNLKTEILTRPVVKQYPVKHPRESVKFGVYRAKYSHLTESRSRVDGHEGGDFLQENALGRVIPFLRRGQIFSQEIFSQAVRMCQHSKEKDSESSAKQERVRIRPKYDNEVQHCAATILYKSQDPMVEVGLGEIHEDALNISQIGKANYKKYFLNRISSVPPGCIKLKPAFITKKSCSDYEKLENQTKSEILDQIKDFLSQIMFEDPLEKQYFENKSMKTYLKKSELIELHTELYQMLNVQNDLNTST